MPSADSSKRERKHRRDVDDDDDDDDDDAKGGRRKERRHRDDKEGKNEDKGNHGNEDKESPSRRHKKRDEEENRRRRRKRSKRDDASDSDDDNSGKDKDKDNDNGNDRDKDKDVKADSSRRKQKKSSSSRRRKHKKSSSRKRSSSKKRRRRSSSSSSSDSDSDSSSSASSSDSDNDGATGNKRHNNTNKKKLNEKLLAKLNARGETLEERKERRSQNRADKIQARFGYSAEDNPFNDPNLHETFTWTKKKEKAAITPIATANPDTLLEIDTIRRRRQEREEERDEMDRLRAEESRMKELENYDDWARKEEEFHLEQQRKRSAIRLVEGREKPVDILAKNLLMFGLTDEEKQRRAAVKYQERYNALDQLNKLEAELEEPHKIVAVLKLAELQELLVEIDAFRMLEKEGMTAGDSKNSILLYWDALYLVTKTEVKLLQNGGSKSDYAKKVSSINEIFAGQAKPALMKMKDEILVKLRNPDGSVDRPYWLQVQEQLTVHFSKLDLSDLHSKMLVRQLERLEQRKEELAKEKKEAKERGEEEPSQEQKEEDAAAAAAVPKNVDANFGNREDELGTSDEVALTTTKKYSWQDRYAPRKPRYFNRVKTGYDWNKYNQTHYDHDNPPPKTVQGYKFNIFYPDLVDPTKTPQFFIEAADSNDFCLLRFSAGAPYEDVAFKIINREWNRSRKRGFKCTFERGVLSLYFNFATHWYRR